MRPTIDNFDINLNKELEEQDREAKKRNLKKKPTKTADLPCNNSNFIPVLLSFIL